MTPRIRPRARTGDRRRRPSATATIAARELQLELVVVCTDQSPTLEASVRRLHAHLVHRPPGGDQGMLLTIADHASTDGTADIAEVLAAELDAAGPFPVRAVRLPVRLDRASLRRQWASSPSQVAAFVTLRPDTDLEQVLAPLDRRVQRTGGGLARAGVISRRTALAALGGGGLVLLAACSGKSSTSGGAAATSSTAGSSTTSASSASSASTASSAAATSAATAGASTTTAPTSVTLAPEMTEGPYYLDLDLVRSDVRENRTGATLNLDFIVMNVATMAPVNGAAVDIWHCDAEGIYSGFVAASTGGGSGTDDSTFLRGTQVSGSDGRVSFTTVYPGWYRGRTVHIHVKVHAGGKEIHTGQLFFDDDFTDTVFSSTAPYSSQGERDVRNEDDGLYGGGGDASTLDVSKTGNSYAATMAMGVRTS